MSHWPKDNQAALIAFYGDPGRGEVARRLVKVTPPFAMYYDKRRLQTITFHEKAAPGLLAALNKIWHYYGCSEATIDKLGISKTAGTYNCRKVRGSATKWSNHAYGAAIDINAEQNGFNVAGNIPLPVIAAFKSEGFRWGGNYKSRKDPMHFEACDGGEPQRSFDEWLKVLGAPPQHAAVEDEKDGVAEDFADDPKPMVKSKIGITQTAIGVGGTALTVDQISESAGKVAVLKQQASDIGVFDVLAHVAHSHIFWIGLAVCVAAGLAFYWRWRDHGGGSQ